GRVTRAQSAAKRTFWRERLNRAVRADFLPRFSTALSAASASRSRAHAAATQHRFWRSEDEGRSVQLSRSLLDSGLPHQLGSAQVGRSSGRGSTHRPSLFVHVCSAEDRPRVYAEAVACPYAFPRDLHMGRSGERTLAQTTRWMCPISSPRPGRA